MLICNSLSIADAFRTSLVVRRALAALALCAVTTVPAVEAQEAARVVGTVRDQAGAPLPGVRVAFGAGESSVTTGERGSFRLPVPAGSPGEVTFRKEGYVEESVRILALQPGSERSLAVTLSSLYTLDALTVVAGRDRPLLNTDDATTGGAVEPQELATLPTDARDPLTLAFNVPGVSQSTGFFGDAPPLTIHGANSLYSQYTVDGLDNNEGFLGGPRVRLPLAAIRRLTVHGSTYRPAYGRSPNGVVDMETRAGGPEWRGDVLFVNRPGSVLDASPKFTPAGVDPEGFERTQVGGSLGGPLVEDRTFLFTALEYTNEQEDRIGSTARADFLGTEVRETWKAFGRVDHGWTPDQTTSLRFAMSHLTREGQGGGVVVPEADITTRRIGTLGNLTHRSSFRGGNASNRLSVQVGSFTWDFPPTESDLATPQVTVVSDDLTTVEAVVGSSNFVFDESELQLQVKEVFEARFGDHRLQLGADVLHSSFELLGANTNPRGAYTVVNEGDITPSGRFLSIDDIPRDVRVLRYSIDANPQQVNLSQTLWGAFVEDRWRPTPSLTLQYGLRWDYDDITSRGESEPDLDNVQPRISASWLAGRDWVVRGGWGLYTGKLPYAVYSDAVQFGPDGNATVTFEGEAFPPPDFLEGPTGDDLEALQDRLPPRETRRMFARGLDQMTSSQLSLGTQVQLGEHWGVSVDGLWVETWDLPRSWDLNAITRPLQPGDSVHRPPDFGDQFRPVEPEPGGFRRLTTTDAGGRARYLALYTTVRRSFDNGLLVEGSWTLSRARNDTEDINFHAAEANDFDDEWADAVNDRRHHLTVRSVWTGGGLELGGVFDYQTGRPVNRVAFFRDLDGSGPIFGNGFIGNHDRFFGVPRNGERLPDAWRVDLSAAYAFSLPTGRLGVRAEAFNVFNTTNYTGFVNGIPGGGPRTQVGRPGDPMEFTAAAPPREFQLSAWWEF